MRLSECVGAFLDAKLAEGVAMTTIRWYEQRLEALVAYLGNDEAENVSRGHLRSFVAHLRRRDELYVDNPYRPAQTGQLSPSTVRGYVRALRCFFRWLEAEDLVARNPASDLKLPPVPKEARKAISDDDLRLLLQASQGEDPQDIRNRALILFLADTGCRVGGLVSLTWRDLDLGRNMATVVEKGDKMRCVLFSETTRRALIQWRTLGVGSGRWVFSSLKTGDRLEATSVNRILERLKAKSGAKGPCNPHSFRHAFARNYLLAGGDLASLSELLGHSDVSVTKRFYARFLVEELRGKHAALSPVNTLDLARIVFEEV